MSDELVSALLQDLNLRVLFASTAGLSREARGLHRAQPAAASLFAQGLTAGALLAALQKEKSRINLQLSCDGPLRGLFVDASAEGWVRGYVNNPYVQYTGAEGKWQWRPALGNSGFLSVLRDQGGGEYYRSSVELERFELAGDLERFFASSEQLPSHVLLEVLPQEGEPLGVVAGLLLQPLPDGDREAFARLGEQLRGPEGFHAALTAHGEGSPVALLQALFPGHTLDVMSRYPLSFRCECSRERVLRALRTVGKAELADMLEKDKKAEMDCHFCGRQYVITEEELRGLHAEAQD